MDAHVYAAMADELSKIASAVGAPEPVALDREAVLAGEIPPHPLSTFAKHLLAIGAGTAAGYGTVVGANALARKLRGRDIITGAMAKSIVPVLGGIVPLIYAASTRDMSDRMDSDHKKRRIFMDAGRL
jgi:hypothetical protein